MEDETDDGAGVLTRLLRDEEGALMVEFDPAPDLRAGVTRQRLGQPANQRRRNMRLDQRAKTAGVGVAGRQDGLLPTASPNDQRES